VEERKRAPRADWAGLVHLDEIEGQVSPGEDDCRVVPPNDGGGGDGGAPGLQVDQLGELGGA
jgi:hypothetical protein